MIWMIIPSRDTCRGTRAIWVESFTFGLKGSSNIAAPLHRIVTTYVKQRE